MESFLNYRTRSEPIEAIQWQPGAIPELVKVAKARVHFSEDQTYYYVHLIGAQCRHWVAVKEVDGPVPEDQRNGALDGFIQMDKLDHSGCYHRKILPFAFWKVREGRQVEVDLNDEKHELYPLIEDYALVEKWNMRDAMVHVLHGSQQYIIRPGDWVVKKGREVTVVTDTQFQKLYEPQSGTP